MNIHGIVHILTVKNIYISLSHFSIFSTKFILKRNYQTEITNKLFKTPKIFRKHNNIRITYFSI